MDGNGRIVLRTIIRRKRRMKFAGTPTWIITGQVVSLPCLASSPGAAADAMRIGLQGMDLLNSLGSSNEGSGELGETRRPPLGSGRLAWLAGNFHQFDIVRHIQLSEIGELLPRGKCHFRPLEVLVFIGTYYGI